jgi:uncharacterized protein (DUF2461 family)
MNDVDVRIYSGMYNPDKKQLLAIREAIASDSSTFKKLYQSKAFSSSFGEIRGEKNKRLPKEFLEAAEKEPLIFNKGFYFFVSLDPKMALSEDLPGEIVKHYRIAKPLNEFFNKAIGA